MLDAEEMVLWCALNRLVTHYWADVDHNAGNLAHEFYEPDGLYAVADNKFEGLEKIRACYTRRRQMRDSAPRTGFTRHLISNLRVSQVNARSARADGVMSLYGADGRPPFSRVRPPSMIADFGALCVLSDGQLWRFQSHKIQPIFVGDDLPSSLLVDPERL